MENTGEILLSLFLMLAAAKLMAEVCERINQPAVVGEILAGVLIGPSVLGWVRPNEIIQVLAEVGVIFLLFSVGLETKPSAILRVGGRATVVAILGVILPFAGGFLLMHAWGANTIEALFIGTAMVATSVGITVRVLAAMGVLDAPTSRIILGAAVIDDVLGLMVLAIVANSAKGAINYIEILGTTGLAIGFTLLVAIFGGPLMKRGIPHVHALRMKEPVYIVGVVLCLGLAVLAADIGVSAIIGAFLAGMALSEATDGNHTVHLQTSGVTEFLVPFFLVSVGMQVQLSALATPAALSLAVLITILAVLTKFVGCGLGSWGIGLRRMMQVGIGMAPRGEVGIVVAQMGLSLGVIGATYYGIVIFMAVATTIIAPLFLRPLFATEAAYRSTIDRPDAGGIVAVERGT
ncbi:MAG: cation:proton antiporter [Chloroflexi bacterium]|nr:MAG: cation:proton antiporter [Chloroflexota bacterium]